MFETWTLEMFSYLIAFYVECPKRSHRFTRSGPPVKTILVDDHGGESMYNSLIPFVIPGVFPVRCFEITLTSEALHFLQVCFLFLHL